MRTRGRTGRGGTSRRPGRSAASKRARSRSRCRRCESCAWEQASVNDAAAAAQVRHTQDGSKRTRSSRRPCLARGSSMSATPTSDTSRQLHSRPLRRQGRESASGVARSRWRCTSERQDAKTRAQANQRELTSTESDFLQRRLLHLSSSMLCGRAGAVGGSPGARRPQKGQRCGLRCEGPSVGCDGTGNEYARRWGREVKGRGGGSEGS